MTDQIFVQKENSNNQHSAAREKTPNGEFVTAAMNGVSRNIKVLMYHRVVEDKRLIAEDSAAVCTHVELFERHLAIIDQLGYTPITLKDYKLYLDGDLNLPKKPIILTFDDGYLDTYTTAYPLLEEYGMKATIFVLGDREVKTNVWDQIQGARKADLMDAAHIVELHNHGFEIGAHSSTHASLTGLGESEAFKEIQRPKDILEGVLGDSVLSFSYPFGEVDRDVKRYVQDAGYTFACSVYTGPPRFGDNLYEIRRLAVHDGVGIGGFTLRLTTPYEHVEWLWGQLHSTRPFRIRNGSNGEHSNGSHQ